MQACLGRPRSRPFEKRAWCSEKPNESLIKGRVFVAVLLFKDRGDILLLNSVSSFLVQSPFVHSGPAEPSVGLMQWRMFAE